jgi:hypothetical protein
MMTSHEQANDLALKQRFLDRATALSNQAEVLRGIQVALLMSEAIASGVRAEADIFQAAYGDPTGQRYWDAHLSEPIPVHLLAYILSAHLAEKIDQLETGKIAIIWAFRDAAEAGERWFFGDATPLLEMNHGQTECGNLGQVKVHPHAAVEWLLSKPKREHLVPTSLRRFLQSGEDLKNSKARTALRPVNQKIAKRFTANYVHGEQAAGRSPTLVGLEAAAKEAGMRGGREYLRTAFRQLRAVRRGRPPKASTKIAEK